MWGLSPKIWGMAGENLDYGEMDKVFYLENAIIPDCSWYGMAVAL